MAVREHDAATTTRRDFPRLDGALLARAAALPTPTLHEAGGKIGALPSAIKPVAPTCTRSLPVRIQWSFA